MQNTSPRTLGRRALLKGTALLAVAATARAQEQSPAAQLQTKLEDAPLGPSVTITAERRGDIVLVGLNRPFIQNRLDPPSRARLGEIFYPYEHDPSLRALVLFGHGEHFSRGIDVDASQAGIIAGQRAVGHGAGDRRARQRADRADRSRSSWWRTAIPGTSGTRSIWRVTSASPRRTRVSARTRTRTAAFPAAAPRCASSARRAGATRCAIC